MNGGLKLDLLQKLSLEKENCLRRSKLGREEAEEGPKLELRNFADVIAYIFLITCNFAQRTHYAR